MPHVRAFKQETAPGDNAYVVALFNGRFSAFASVSPASAEEGLVISVGLVLISSELDAMASEASRSEKADV